MTATLAALAALAGCLALEAADPAPVGAALEALGAAFRNAMPVASIGGFVAMADTQLTLAVAGAAFAGAAVAAAGAGRLAVRWLHWRARDAAGAVTAVLLGLALGAGLMQGVAALRIAHPVVPGVILPALLVAGGGVSALVRGIRGIGWRAPGWIGTMAIAAAAAVTLAALAPATGDPALTRTMPAAAALRWGDTGAAEALMGASYRLDGAIVETATWVAARLGLFQDGDPAFRMSVADAAARLWSPAGWLLAAAALGASFRPRAPAGWWIAVAIVATSPALAGLALADQPRLFMLAPAVACAGWVGRGRIGRGAALAVVAGWFGAGGEPGRVPVPDLLRLACAGLAGGALIAANAPGRVLRVAGALVFSLAALRTIAFATATGGLLAGAGLESHRGYTSRSLGVHADLQDRIDRLVPPGERLWQFGARRAWPATRAVTVASARALAQDAAAADSLRRQARQAGIRWVVDWPEDRVGAPASGPGWTTASLRIWTEWWSASARLAEAPARLDPVRGGAWLYRLEPARGTGVPPTLPGFAAGTDGRVAPGAGADRIPRVAAALALSASPPDEARLLAADRAGYLDVGLWEALAATAAGRRDAAAALRWQEKILEFAPAYGSAGLRRLHLELARRARAAKEPRDAEAHLRAALGLDPRDAAVWAELAEMLLWLGRKAEALDAMEQAVRHDPKHPGYRGTYGHMRRAS